MLQLCFSTEMIRYAMMKFPIHISGNEHGQYNPNNGDWTAPVTGRYEFGLFVAVSAGTGPYYYQILLEIDDQTEHYFRCTGTRAADSTNRDGRYFRAEIDLVKHQVVHLEIYYPTPGLDYYRDSFWEGKLIKRY